MFGRATRDGEGRIRPAYNYGPGGFDYGSYQYGYQAGNNNTSGNKYGNAAEIGNSLLGLLGGVGTSNLSGTSSLLNNDPTYQAFQKWATTPTYDPSTGQTRLIHTDNQAALLANLQNEARYREGLALSQMSENNLRQSFSDVLGKFREARAEVEGIGQTGRADLMGRERQQLGGTQMSLQSRGLGNTTVADNARRGIMADTNRGMNDLNERLANLRSGLNVQEAGARQQQGNLLSNLYSERAGMIERRTDFGQQNSGESKSNNRGQDLQTALALAGLVAAFV